MQAMATRGVEAAVASREHERMTETETVLE